MSPSEPSSSEPSAADARPGARPTAVDLNRGADPAVVAVIAAAVDAVWPRPVIVAAAEPEGPPAWRFSGRWWAKPMTARRDRPWLR